MGQEELEAIGLDEDSGRDHLLAALDTIDRLSTYNDEEAWDSYCDFMGRNFTWSGRAAGLCAFYYIEEALQYEDKNAIWRLFPEAFG